MRKYTRIITRRPTGALLLIMLLSITFAAGCATWDDRDPRPPKLSLPEFSDDGLIKKVALSLFENQTQLRFEEIEQSFLLPLTNHLKSESNDILLSTPYDAGFPETLISAAFAAAKGNADNLTLSKTGRSLGFTAVITGRLYGISGFEKEKGFWIFKETRHYEKIMIQVGVYDVETGAKLLNEAYSKEIEISAAEFEALAAGTVVNTSVVMEAFQELAEDIAEGIGEILEDTPWVSFVTRTDNQEVTLSSGADAGLKPGIRLELYDSDKELNSPNGNHFFIPGVKSGEIEIIDVTPNSARARLLPESKAAPGYAVRIR